MSTFGEANEGMKLLQRAKCTGEALCLDGKPHPSPLQAQIWGEDSNIQPSEGSEAIRLQSRVGEGLR